MPVPVIIFAACAAAIVIAQAALGIRSGFQLGGRPFGH